MTDRPTTRPQLNIRLDPVLIDRVRAAAALRGQTASEAAREAIADWLAARETRGDRLDPAGAPARNRRRARGA